MARTPKGTPPSYPSKPHKGQARVTIRLANGKRRDIYLGPFGSPESRVEYRRVLAELEASGGYYQDTQPNKPFSDLTVAEMLLRFWQHAEAHYRLADGSPSRELEHYHSSLKPVLELYGETLAREFGPLALKAVRECMVKALQYHVRPVRSERTKARWVCQDKVKPEERLAQLQGKEWCEVDILDKRLALSRKVINQRVDHIRRVWRWAASEELVPQAIYDALTTVTGIRRGQQGTRDKPAIKPVADDIVEKTLPFLMPPVRAMVQLQRLMGARATEVCLMRPCNIDRSGPVWWYRLDPNEVAREEGPGRTANLHKCAHHEDSSGHAAIKVLPIGPKGQEILKPFLEGRNPSAFLFSPAEAKAFWSAERRKQRQCKLWDSHLVHQASKRKSHPNRAPRDHYDRWSYAHAIARACKKAGVPRWHAHQLKHAAGTLVRQLHGAEAARVFLGHSSLKVSEIYAEADLNQVARIALEIG